MKPLTLISDSTGRLDRFLTHHIDSSRNQIEQLIKEGFVTLDGKITTKPGIKLKPDQKINVTFPEAEEKETLAVNFDVPILHEDDSILIINKPPNLTIHDAPSVKEATLVDWLKSKPFSLSTLSGEERHGIVHRLDKETSGVMVIAKTNESHRNLSEQLSTRTMGRYYLALIDLPLKGHMIVEKPLARHPKNRLKMGIIEGGRYAKSAFAKVLESSSHRTELIAAKLFTGRTHQIRAHLASVNRHILGDSLYGFKSRAAKIPRICLHAYYLYLTHPETGEDVFFKAPFPADMQSVMGQDFNTGDVHEKIDPVSLLALFDSLH